MNRCDAETCPFWTGDGCVCDVLDLRPERYDRPNPEDEEDPL